MLLGRLIGPRYHQATNQQRLGGWGIEKLVGSLPDDVLTWTVPIEHVFPWICDPVTGEHLERNSGVAFKAAQACSQRRRGPLNRSRWNLHDPREPLRRLHPGRRPSPSCSRLGLERCSHREIRSLRCGYSPWPSISPPHVTSIIAATINRLVDRQRLSRPHRPPSFSRREPEIIRMRERLPALQCFATERGCYRCSECRGLDQGLAPGQSCDRVPAQAMDPLHRRRHARARC